MSARVKIVTDSTAYLLPETVARYDIRVVPLKVIFGNESFAEGVDITNEEFYQRLAKSKALPTTSQPSVSDFIRVYAELTQPGYDIFSIHISGKLSGTINSALAARAAFPQARIEVMDWLSMGMGLLVLAAARAAEEGQGLAEIKAMIKRLTANMNIFGTLGTLKYLQKGGRIGAAATLVGTLLKIKPVLALDNGEVRVLAKPRNRDKAMQCMLKFMAQRVEEKARIHGAIIGLSGGLDSSVVLALSVAALGPDKVLGLIMPERDSQPDSEPDARLQTDRLGVKVERVELTSILGDMGIYHHLPEAAFARRGIAAAAVKAGYKLYAGLTGERPFLSGLEGTSFGPLKRANAYYRMKHRVRMVLLYSYAERQNLLVVGTANKTEFLTGFFIKYGDGAADIMPLLGLYKAQVRQLAKFLHVPEKIINKAPSPDLIPGITDEFAIGITYEKLDLVLAGLEANMETKEIAEASGVKQEAIEYVRELVKRSEYMRNPPLIPD